MDERRKEEQLLRLRNYKQLNYWKSWFRRCCQRSFVHRRNSVTTRRGDAHWWQRDNVSAVRNISYDIVTNITHRGKTPP